MVKGNAKNTPTIQSSKQVPIPQKKGYLYFLFPSETEINSYSINKVKDAIKNATLSKLYLVVDSPGGDLYSAVKIIRILRTKFTHISGIVPYRAMSAATLMLLGTDEIYMSEESQLGPLDLPMEHPMDGSPISTADVVDTLNQLSTTMMNNATNMYEKMRELPNQEKIGKNKAMELALNYSAELVKPIAKNIDPYHRQKAFRKLKIAQWYAYDLLRTKMMKSKSNRAWTTASRFVYYFPDHSYAIFKEEAKDSLGLEIRDSAILSNWNNICQETELKLTTSTTQIISYLEK